MPILRYKSCFETANRSKKTIRGLNRSYQNFHSPFNKGSYKRISNAPRSRTISTSPQPKTSRSRALTTPLIDPQTQTNNRYQSSVSINITSTKPLFITIKQTPHKIQIHCSNEITNPNSTSVDPQTKQTTTNFKSMQSTLHLQKSSIAIKKNNPQTRNHTNPNKKRKNTKFAKSIATTRSRTSISKQQATTNIKCMQKKKNSINPHEKANNTPKKITHYNSKHKTTRIAATNNQNSQKGYQDGEEEKRGKTETYGGGTVGRRISREVAAGRSGEIGHRRVPPETSPEKSKEERRELFVV